MSIQQQIEKILSELPLVQRIDIIERLGKKYRRQNSINLNAKQYGRKVDERSDEMILKYG